MGTQHIFILCFGAWHAEVSGRNVPLWVVHRLTAAFVNVAYSYNDRDVFRCLLPKVLTFDILEILV